MSMRDWVSRLMATVGEPDIEEKLGAGQETTGKTFKVHNATLVAVGSSDETYDRNNQLMCAAHWPKLHKSLRRANESSALAKRDRLIRKHRHDHLARRPRDEPRYPCSRSRSRQHPATV
jgi:hypothetical protein